MLRSGDLAAAAISTLIPWFRLRAIATPQSTSCGQRMHSFTQSGGLIVGGGASTYGGMRGDGQMLQHTMRVLGAVALMFWFPLATAQEAPVRVRGTIERVDGDVYLVKSRTGDELKLKLAENATVVALIKATLADIKQGSYVGVSGLPQPDGTQKALEVHIFPESMRGVGDGHRGWDLQPSSTMTNGNVEQTAASSDGQVLMLKYKDGEKRVLVSPDTPIVVYTRGERSELTPGAHIFVSAAIKQPDGTLQAPRVNVGRGVAPPM